jgi:hypothetical protein
MITKVPQGIKCIPDPAFSNIIKNLVVFRAEFRVCHDDLMFVEIVQFKMYAKSTSLAALNEIRTKKIMVPEVIPAKITPD